MLEPLIDGRERRHRLVFGEATRFREEATDSIRRGARAGYKVRRRSSLDRGRSQGPCGYPILGMFAVAGAQGV
jgi:hypothetical protein